MEEFFRRNEYIKIFMKVLNITAQFSIYVCETIRYNKKNNKKIIFHRIYYFDIISITSYTSKNSLF